MEQTRHLELRAIHMIAWMGSLWVERGGPASVPRFEDFASPLNEIRKEDLLLIDISPFSRYHNSS